MRILVVFFVLVGVNVYFLGLRGGTSIGALLRTTRVHASGASPLAGATPVVAKAPLPPLPEDPPGGRVLEAALADGETVAQALTPRVGKRLAAVIEQALGEHMDLASVHAGQVYTLLFDVEDRPVAFEFRIDNMVAHHLDLSGRKAIGTTLMGKADTKIAELALPAGPTLWDALRKAGETPALGERLAELFGAEGDLLAAGAGERLRVLVEKRTIGGRFVRYGRVLGAEWVTHAGIRRAFSFAGSAYTERGEAVARSYLLSAIRPTRLAAPGRRDAHVLGEERVTVEQRAATGAYVWAVAAGTITAMSHNAAGNTLTLEVAPGERVVYTHLGRLARGLQLGHHVLQGQTLSRVDGVVTLTYEGAAAAMHDGRAQAPRLVPLSALDRPRFGESIAPLLERLRALALRTADPLAARGLSAIP